MSRIGNCCSSKLLLLSSNVSLKEDIDISICKSCKFIIIIFIDSGKNLVVPYRKVR
ncbi:hypothetical protein SLEP1_g693 [Rubroshorea leprosula]|uniref:Uncharacterized protein n=1 Tax=Rubroshorea leprosula TaxID=152421 RepID=A0AAV5HG44_9ROSI|nr:hypothetical protein SLEP1_g693 [Rubroshorea leprosula]